jgi:dihydroxy-acid dehydratase
VVLTTGCDKTTPAQLMAVSTVDIPAIVLSGGPMLDGHMDGELVGSGAAIWKGRRQLAAGAINEEKFLEIACASAPSAGHCNTMGTASTMNAIAEALGMSLPGCSAIPAPYRERGQMAYETGRRIVELARQDIKPSQILTRDAFLDAIVVNAAIGGSTNAQPHIMAMARHAGVEIHPEDWMEFGYDVPLMLNMQPAGKYLGERFHRAGGVPSIMWELEQKGKLRSDRPTVSGKTMKENLVGRESRDREMIKPFDAPMMDKGGFMVLKGNLFNFAIMKTSVISAAFRERYLSTPGKEGQFDARAIVFDGSTDYHNRINDPSLNIDENCILVIRGSGPIGWPGSAEVVNMQPPDHLIKKGVMALPTLGDGRQSGTSDSPSILNASPESAAGGGLAFLRTGDTIRVNLTQGTVDALVPEDEWNARKQEALPAIPESQTPWQEIYRATVGQLETGACMEPALKYRRVAEKMPRHNH